MFLIYTENIYKIKLNGTLILYADDTPILYSGQNVNTLEQQINNDLKKTWEVDDTPSINYTYNENEMYDHTQQQKY